MANNNQYEEVMPIETEDECGKCKKKDKRCVSYWEHENAMMHKDFDNERAHKTTWFVCITVLLLTLIFVGAYTFRMNSFLDTIKEMTAVIMQLASAKGIISP